MPTDVTTYLILEMENEKALGPSRVFKSFLVLDEGFDRPFWFYPSTGARRKPAFVPKSPATIAADGIMHLLENYDPDLSNFFFQLKEEVETIEPKEVNGSHYAQRMMGVIEALKFANFRFTFVLHQDSGIYQQVTQLQKLTSKVVILGDLSKPAQL